MCGTGIFLCENLSLATCCLHCIYYYWYHLESLFESSLELRSKISHQSLLSQRMILNLVTNSFCLMLSNFKSFCLIQIWFLFILFSPCSSPWTCQQKVTVIRYAYVAFHFGLLFCFENIILQILSVFGLINSCVL